MAKYFDPQIVNPIFTGYIEELITTKGNLVPTKPFDLAVKPIDKYEGRMRVSATNKMDVAAYVAVVNYYLNKVEMQARRARGAMVFYMDIEVADKLFKAAGLEVPYDEDDESMMTLCGSLSQLIANNFKDSLASSGFLSLEFSTPAVYKNTVPEGVEFSKDQDEKQGAFFLFPET